MNKKYFITYDFGSGSVKAVISDRSYKIFGIQNVPYKTYFPQIGWATQKPHELTSAMAMATKGLLDSAGVEKNDILGIAIAQTATIVIFVDQAGNPISDAVIWMDGRAQRQAEKINDKLGVEKFNGKNVIAKLLWFLEKEPMIVSKASYMLDLSSFFFLTLTRELAYEFTGARSTCLIDIENRSWDEKMFDLIKFPRKMVPDRIVASTEIVGKISPEGSSIIGLQAGTPVFGGCSDHAAAVLGSGCIRSGDAHIYIGTSAWLAVTTPDEGAFCGFMPSPVPKSKYHFYNIDSGGECIDYLIRTYYKSEMYKDANIYNLLEDEIKNAENENGENILFLPFLTGASSPISEITMRATLINIKNYSTRKQISRAVIEGVCMNLRWMKEIHSQDNGWDINFLRGIGGGLQSEIFAQILADVMGDPFTILENIRYAGNLGLSACIDVGLGLAKDFTVLDRVVRDKKTFYPNPDKERKYARLYDIFREAFENLKNVYRRLNVELLERI